LNKQDSPLNTNVLVLGLTSMISTFCLSLWQGYLSLYFAGIGYEKWEIGILYTLGAVAIVAVFFYCRLAWRQIRQEDYYCLEHCWTCHCLISSILSDRYSNNPWFPAFQLVHHSPSTQLHSHDNLIL